MISVQLPLSGPGCQHLPARYSADRPAHGPPSNRARRNLRPLRSAPGAEGLWLPSLQTCFCRMSVPILWGIPCPVAPGTRHPRTPSIEVNPIGRLRYSAFAILHSSARFPTCSNHSSSSWYSFTCSPPMWESLCTAESFCAARDVVSPRYEVIQGVAC
jgi:hypothetical protein